jgi:hypothetical protein
MANANTQQATSRETSYPNPDGDPQPGPWDPIIRQAFDKVFGPFPEPWRWSAESRALRRLAEITPEVWDAIDDRLSSVALNPQPLPPRWKFPVEFARAAMDRFETIQETAEIIGGESGGDRAIIVVGGKVSELVDEVCGTSFPRKFPVPPPRGGELGEELIVMGMEFLRGSHATANSELAGQFGAAGRRLIEEGTSRL